jgi:acetyltransferase
MIWANEAILADLRSGNVALISQSGSGAVFVARSTSSARFSHIVSTGNEAALTTADYVQALADDPATDVIGLILESVHDAPTLATAVRRAKMAGKAVVALRVGISEAGARATVAHTGAMLADDAVAGAFFQSIDVPLVSDYDELASTLDLLAGIGRRTLGAARAAVATISGGQSALSADLAAQAGVALVELSEATHTALSQILPGSSINNPLDVGGSVEAQGDYWRRSLELLGADESVDVVVAVLDAQSSLSDSEILYEEQMYRQVQDFAARTHKPVIVASSSSLTLHPRRMPGKGDAAIVIRGIRNAFVALAAAVKATHYQVESVARPLDLPDEHEIHAWRSRLSAIDDVLGADVAHDLLADYGLHTVRSTRVRTVDEALAWAGTEGYPLVLKVDSPDVAHRSDIGAVVLGIADENALRVAWEDIEARVRAHSPDARILGMEVQVQVNASLEAFIGMVSDVGIGATVSVGMGGVLIELLGDASSAFVPLSEHAARTALESTRLHRLMSGFRELNPVVDSAPLVDALVRVSWMAEDLRGVLVESDFNPVLIDTSTGHPLFVDALIVASAER